MSLFNNLIGLGGEDLTTEVLVYLLSNKNYVHVANLVMPILITNFNQTNKYIIETQKSFTTGRPDIVIESDDSLIIIENKFNAEFSQGNQINRYIDILLESDAHNKELVLLTVRNRVNYLESKIKEQIDSVDIGAFCLKKRITYKTVLWDEILNKIYTNDSLTKELKKFIYSNYIKNTAIGDFDLENLNNDNVAILIEKIWDAIDINKNFMSGHGYKVSRKSQSRTTYLFNIDFAWGSVCIQYYHYFWIKYKTPFSLQVMYDWNKKEVDLSKLKALDFVDDEEYEYVLPITITGEDISEELNAKVLEVMKGIDDLFS